MPTESTSNQSGDRAYPSWNSPFLNGLGRRWLSLRGWAIEGALPGDISKYVIIVAPHSSNWDFVYGLAAAFAVDLKPAFIGKHTLFVWPLGPVMRRLGGIPVDRSHTSGLVGRVSALIRETQRIVVAIAPEGTRKAGSEWRTGFYHIAREAEVPIVPAFIDHNGRRVGIGEPFETTGDVDEDVAQLREFYAHVARKR